MNPASISSLGFDSSSVQPMDSTFNLGIYLTFTSFRMDRLIDVCCDDITLVTDVLDTFCVQGRLQLESLDSAIELEDLSSARFNAVR